MELGYEDIYKPEPYLDSEQDGSRVLVHMLYVPPDMRRKGIGRALFKHLLESLDTETKYIRLHAAQLGSGDTLNFWKSLGFKEAYSSSNNDNKRILHLAVNNYQLPQPIEVGAEEMHYIFD